MYADYCTTNVNRISYACILVEMDVTRPLPGSVNVCEPEGRVVDQVVLYDLKPVYCPICCQMGHFFPIMKMHKVAEQRQQQPEPKQKKEWKFHRTLDPKVDDTIDGQGRLKAQLCPDEMISIQENDRSKQVLTDDWIEARGRFVTKVRSPALVQIGNTSVFNALNTGQ